MRLVTPAVAACALSVFAPAHAADVAGAKDPPGFKRFQGSEIVFFETRSYDEYILARGPGSPGEGFAKAEKVEGSVTRLLYRVPEGHTSLELLRNYEQMVTAAGLAQNFELKTMSWDGYFYNKFYDQTHTHDDNSYLKNVKNPMYFTAKGTKGGQDWNVAALIVESTGYTWAFGNNQKIAVKTESTSTLREVASLLKEHPTLHLLVAGHTDNTGGAEHNLRLSEGRASTVVSALVKQHGVAAARLQPKGFGDTQPVASNDSEEGRAKNRRVELRKI